MNFKHVNQGSMSDFMHDNPNTDIVFCLTQHTFGITVRCVDKNGQSNNIVTIKKNGFLFRHPAVIGDAFCTDSECEGKIRVSVNRNVT